MILRIDRAAGVDWYLARVSHQTVRLSRGSHRSQSAGACAMELASMLANESFSDRPQSVSPVIGAFVRTYNDGLDDGRRQDLLPIAADIVGTAAPPRVEEERVSMCLRFARRHGAPPPSGRAALALATPEAAGASAAQAALRRGPTRELHAEALAFVGELVAAASRPPALRRSWRRRPPRAAQGGPPRDRGRGGVADSVTDVDAIRQTPSIGRAKQPDGAPPDPAGPVANADPAAAGGHDGAAGEQAPAAAQG